jgi:hypothetical protein
MSQNGAKNKSGNNKKPVFVRGIQPSTKEWLQSKVDPDAPSIPRVVKRIVENEHRREIEQKRKR